MENTLKIEEFVNAFWSAKPTTNRKSRSDCIFVEPDSIFATNELIAYRYYGNEIARWQKKTNMLVIKSDENTHCRAVLHRLNLLLTNTPFTIDSNRNHWKIRRISPELAEYSWAGKHTINLNTNKIFPCSPTYIRYTGSDALSKLYTEIRKTFEQRNHLQINLLSNGVAVLYFDVFTGKMCRRFITITVIGHTIVVKKGLTHVTKIFHAFKTHSLNHLKKYVTEQHSEAELLVKDLSEIGVTIFDLPKPIIDALAIQKLIFPKDEKL